MPNVPLIEIPKLAMHSQAVVTIAGGADADCVDAAGTYVPATGGAVPEHYRDRSQCIVGVGRYRFKHSVCGTDASLWLYQCRYGPIAVWAARLVGSNLPPGCGHFSYGYTEAAVCPCASNYWFDPTIITGLTIDEVNDKLVGNFILDGDDRHGACTGYTATVTFS